MPAPRLPLRQQHLVPVALAIAVALLSYFAHVVQLAAQRGTEQRAPSTAARGAPMVDDTDTIAFAVHTVAPAGR